MKNLLAALILLWIAGSASAYVAYDSTNLQIGGNIIIDNVLVTVSQPPNNVLLPQTFQVLCNNTCGYLPGAGTTVENVTLWNSSGEVAYMSSSSTPNICGTYAVNVLAPKLGNYKISCLWDNIVGWSSTNPSANISVNITSGAAGQNVLGDCITSLGYKAVITPTATRYVRLNMTGLGAYLVDNNGSNVYIANLPTYLAAADSKTIVVDTLTDKRPFNVYIGSYGFNTSRTVVTLSPYDEYNLTTSNFALEPDTYSYFVNIRNELNGGVASYANATIEQLKIQCKTYSPSTLNLIGLGNLSSVLVITKEKPTVQLISARNYYTFSAFQIRSVNPDINNGTFNMYQADGHSDLMYWTFTLYDFAGEIRGRGKMRISANVNGTVATIYNVPWDFQTIDSVYLLNNTDYLVEAYIPGSIDINYGWFTVTDNGSKVLTVTQPAISPSANHWKGIYYEFLSDYSTGTVGLVYNVTTGGTNSVTFKVFDNNNVQVYSTTATTDSGVFSFVMPIIPPPVGCTINSCSVPYTPYQTYWGRVIFDVQNHSILDVTSPLDTTNTLNVISSYSLSGLASALGFSEDQVKLGIVWILMGMTAFLASSVHLGLFAVIIAMETLMEYAFGWIPAGFESLIVFTFVVAVAIKVASDRSEY